MKPIIEVKGLWKEYQRGAQKERYLSLRDQVFNVFKPTPKKDSFYALEDINFDVYPGDSLAIIGKNGAGKSTLLKILSKITPPTKGEIILRGRLASLLEVGTGFHAELTGRENIYLNGSILGLKRHEINTQFDEIVEFSGVEDFLDTPLKHYSSGMQLRLAFAVAAHLEPEILVIDEVLAVGDSAFQQKCINKMTEVSQSGRTIIFVSHNMQAVRNLCEKGVLLKEGKIEQVDKIDSVIATYNSNNSLSGNYINLLNIEERRGSQKIRFESIEFEKAEMDFGETIIIKLKFKTIEFIPFNDLDIGVGIVNQHNNTIIHMTNRFIGKLLNHTDDNNFYVFSFESLLRPGVYKVNLFLRANDEIQDWLTHAVEFKIKQGNPYGFHNSDGIQGVFFPNFQVVLKK